MRKEEEDKDVHLAEDVSGKITEWEINKTRGIRGEIQQPELYNQSCR